MTLIKAIALDVDGVLTDGGIWWGPQGEEWKRFSFRDVMAVSLARKAGLLVALISGEDSPLVDRFARKFNLAHVYAGCKDKAAALQAFADSCGFSLREIAFMGDDVNDAPAMRLCGFPAAPADAHATAREVAHFITNHGGGHGAVRELVDHLLSEKSQRARRYP